MSSTKRTDRVAGEIHAILADALRSEVKDPRITAITLTGVRLSADLGVAKVMFTPLGGEGDVAAISRGLHAASGFLRRELGRRLQLRHVPALVFEYDDNLDDAIRMTSLLSRMEEEDNARDLGRAQQAADEGDEGE